MKKRKFLTTRQIKNLIKESKEAFRVWIEEEIAYVKRIDMVEKAGQEIIKQRRKR